MTANPRGPSANGLKQIETIRRRRPNSADDLLYIPPSLRRGTPESDKVLALGAARLKANPALGAPEKRAQAVTRIAPTKTQKKRAARARSDVYRQQLLDAGHSVGFVNALSPKKAEALVGSIIKGEGITREDLI